MLGFVAAYGLGGENLAAKPIKVKCPSDGHEFEVDLSEVERQGGYAHCPMCGVRINVPAGTFEVEGRDSKDVERVAEKLLAQQQHEQSRRAEERPADPRETPPPPLPPRGRASRRRPRAEWLAVAVVAVALLAWFALAPGYTSGGVAIVVLGLAVTTALAISGWPRTKETGTATGLIVAALTAIGTGAVIATLGGGHEARQQTTTATQEQPHPAAQKAPSGFPKTGPTLRVSNKVTDGPQLMREDSAHVAYLSTVMRDFCKDAGCAIPGTDVSTGDTLGPAICQGHGERTTNGNDSSTVDDNNPGLYSSDRWYGVRRRDGTIGYISEVWIDPSQRGGLGLRSCPPR